MNTEKRPVLCTTLYRKPMQPCNFDGILYQLRHWNFHTVFTRRSVLKGTLRRDQKVIFVKSPISSPIVMPYCRIWAVRASRLLATLLRVRVCVCVCVRSINAWVSNSSLNGGCTWRPVRSFSSGRSGRGRPLPASWPDSVRADRGSPIHFIVLRARAPIIDQLPVVVAHSSSVPGRLNRFVCWSSRVKCVGLALFMQLLQAWSFALRTSCRSTWLVSILGRRADRSCSVRSNHSAWSPARQPGESPLLFVHESRVCMTVFFQCKLWLLPALFISQSPAHHRVDRDAPSRDRERGGPASWVV